jgi:hypothetical protein
MRAQSSEQFDPSDAWRAAQGFLQLHGRSPDAEHLSPQLVQLLMVGVWVGCRLALLNRDLALAIAALGNAQSGVVFEPLRRGFASEFGESMQEVVHDALYDRGFTNAWTKLAPREAEPAIEVDPAPEPLTGPDVIAAAQEFLRKLQRNQGGDAPGGSR